MSSSIAHEAVCCLHHFTVNFLQNAGNVRLPCSISYKIELPVYRPSRSGWFWPVQVLAVQTKCILSSMIVKLCELHKAYPGLQEVL